MVLGWFWGVLGRPERRLWPPWSIGADGKPPARSRVADKVHFTRAVRIAAPHRLAAKEIYLWNSCLAQEVYLWDSSYVQKNQITGQLWLLLQFSPMDQMDTSNTKSSGRQIFGFSLPLLLRVRVLNIFPIWCSSGHRRTENQLLVLLSRRLTWGGLTKCSLSPFSVDIQDPQQKPGELQQQQITRRWLGCIVFKFTLFTFVSKLFHCSKTLYLRLYIRIHLIALRKAVPLTRNSTSQWFAKRQQASAAEVSLWDPSPVAPLSRMARWAREEPWQAALQPPVPPRAP